MKRNFLMKLLSFVLAVLAVVMLFPYGTLTAYATDNNPQSDELPADETSTDSQNIADPPEGDEPAEPAADGVELETEVLYYEYEIENTAMPAPPMTNIGGSVDPNALELNSLADGVYAIENVGNDNYFMSVQGGYIESGYRIQQQNYGSNTPLTDFSGLSLFKVSRIGTTNKYIIRSMLGNRMSFGIESEADGSVVSTQFIDPDDSKVTDGYVYTITYSAGGYLIKPYGNSKVITAPNSTASGDAGGVAAQLFLSTQSEAGNRGKWRFTKYTGNTIYGVSITRTAGMGNGIVKGKTGTIWVNSWSTVIGANTPYIAVDPGYTNIASSSWTQSNFSTKVTALKCGDFQMKSEIRTGSSTAATHTLYSTYTVIPDIVGDTAFVQNVSADKYMEIKNGSTIAGGIAQLNTFGNHAKMQWVFELGGSGYFKIKNVNSGRYLGVDSSDITKVKQYSTVTDYTLWKLTETSNGRYKISCKASALSGKVLSIPTSTGANGTELTMLAYVSDSDYKDEWAVYKGKILSSVPTSLRSTSDHLCIPCAITNVAGYWSISGYSQFGCSSSTQQENVARAVHQRMQSIGGTASANRNIQIGYDYFSHTSGTKKYVLKSTNIWRGDANFSIETVKNEIDAGRPIMIGYAAVDGSPYAGHMTVASGYIYIGGSFFVYVSDAHNSAYQRHLFNANTYNDFIATVECVVSSN